MTSLFTFPNEETTEAADKAEAAQRINEEYDTNYKPEDASESQEPDEKEFSQKYLEPDDHSPTVSGNPHLLETFGAELEKVLAIHAENPRRVWTLLDGDDGITRLCAGYHTVNRINYLTTTKPWEQEDECYVW